MHTIQYYLAIRSNEILIHATTWMKLKNIPAAKDSVLYDSVYIECLEKADV